MMGSNTLAFLESLEKLHSETGRDIYKWLIGMLDRQIIWNGRNRMKRLNK